MREGTQAKLREESASKLATVHGLTEDLKEHRDTIQRNEAREGLLERQHASGEEELASLLEEAARHGASLEASAVVERTNTPVNSPDPTSLWNATVARAVRLETRALDEAQAKLISSEAKVLNAWNALMGEKAAVDQSRCSFFVNATATTCT